MSQASLIRKLSRKTVSLPAATSAAREAGEIGPEESVEVTIRKVRASEVTACTGVPKSIYQLAADRQKGETREEQQERLQKAMTDDDDAIRDGVRMARDQARAIVALGVIEPAVRVPGEKGDDGDLAPEDFGEDFEFVHDQIIEFSSLDYQRLGGAGMETFPADGVADRPEPDGGAVREDAESAPS